MKQPTICERRNAQVYKLVEYCKIDYKSARTLLNRYYRYVALEQRCNILENDERYYNTKYQIEQSNLEEKRYNELSTTLKRYNLKLFRPWSCSWIETLDGTTIVEPILY